MADNRTSAPAFINTLPRWAYLALALACVCMGVWASYITLEYFEHGAKALETDKALQALAVSAAVMFVASEMAAFALAAVLTERQLKARRWSLTAFAVAVLALEVCTIVAVQLALTVGADMTQTSVIDTVADLQKQITTVEANAKTYAATAESLRAADQLKKAALQSDKAAAETAKASQLYDRLEEARKQKRPTLGGLMGEKTALSYAIARGILVSLAGLVFFGTAGALLRSARGGASVDQQILELLHRIHGGSAAIPSQAVTFDLEKAKATHSISYGKTMMAGAGALAAMAAPVAHSAPAVPDVKGASEVTHSTPTGASEVTQQPKKRRHKSTIVAAGAKCDTGTGEHDGARYRRVKAAVEARLLEPGLRSIQQVEGGGAPTVRGYLAKMVEEGIIKQKADGHGYELVKGAA